MLIIFELLIGALVYLDYFWNKKRLSPFSSISIPYMIIIFINNIFATKLGFYKINDEVILMIGGGLVIFYIGSVTSYLGSQQIYKSNVIDSSINKFRNYKIDNMVKYALVAETLVLGRVLFVLIKEGIGFFIVSANEGYLLTGILGHLLLTLYPIIPILTLYWLQNKKEKKVFFVVALAIVLFFMTFVKYHVLCLVVLIFLFISFEDRTYLKKGSIALLIMAGFLFVCNYLFSFMFYGVTGEFQADFYLTHFWKYLASSLIHDNDIFTVGLRTDLSGLYKIGHLFFALSNMFIKKICGYELFVEIGEIDFAVVSESGAIGNVIDFIGFLFPSKGSAVDYMVFIITMFFFGFLTTGLYGYAKRKTNTFTVAAFVPMTFFCFFSFFAVYGGLKVPWEILIWSFFIPWVFSKKRRFVFGKI